MVKLVHPELSYKILGILFTVHNQLGPDCNEKHYQRAIRECFVKENMEFAEQVKIDIRRPEYIGAYYMDFVVERKIVLEIKASPRISRNHVLQLLRYLKETGIELGILVNFSRRDLIYKRILKGFKCL